MAALLVEDLFDKFMEESNSESEESDDDSNAIVDDAEDIETDLFPSVPIKAMLIIGHRNLKLVGNLSLWLEMLVLQCHLLIQKAQKRFLNHFSTMNL